MLKALGVVVCVAVASSAYAQSSDAAATDSTTTTSKPRFTSTKKTDRKLGLDVRRALGKANGVDISHIFVRARGGAVTLTGSVPNGDQILKVGDIAKGVAGVTSVSNKLSLSPQNGP
jgi:hyperosmotically inducible periplasmic protein